ncbi:glycosyltransferase family 4 protein [Spirillospora sp. NPDC127200]
MRILHVHWTALPVTGGVEVHCAALVGQLTALGADAMLVSGTRGARVGHRQAALELGAACGPADLEALVARCREADIVHWHNPQWHKPHVTEEAARRLRARGWPGRLVYDLHNIDDVPEHWGLLARLADRYVAHSPFVAREVEAHVPGSRVEVLPLALDRAPRPYELPRAATRVALQPTRLTTWKGSDLSLRAAVTLLEAGCDDLAFVHAGTRNLVWPPGIPAELLERVRPWRDRGRIEFVHYEPAQSWRAIEAADVVLHPTADRGTHGEPFSLSVAQAVILGRPVVASESGHLPRLLEGYSLARLVPPGDQEAVTRALAEVGRAGPAEPTAHDRELGARLAEEFASSGVRHLAHYGAAPPEPPPADLLPESRR